ncbi:short-chain dehydrogenase/reductase SDR [Rhypophila decipiens]
MATFDPTKFELTPEEQASIPRFLRQQVTAKPRAVTTQDVDLNGKTAIVTGSNTGVGLETARQLLDLGISKLILAVRNVDKGTTAKTDLADGRDLNDGDNTTEVWQLDMADNDSIRAFAARAGKELTRLDIVVLNAGIGPITRTFNTRTGHDEVIQVNYLSTALLAILLLSVLKKSQQATGSVGRLTIVASELAGVTKFKEATTSPPPVSILAALDDKNTKVDMLDRMMVSKLLQQFFVVKIATVVSPDVAIINSVSPGSVYGTEFNRDRRGTVAGAVAGVVMKLMANPPQVGARMITDAAVLHGEETHGQFLSFQKIVPMPPIIYQPEGERISEQLWKETLAEFSFAGAVEKLRELAD